MNLISAGQRYFRVSLYLKEHGGSRDISCGIYMFNLFILDPIRIALIAKFNLTGRQIFKRKLETKRWNGMR